MKFIQRPIDIQKLQWLIERYPVTAVVGTRQCGKTTLVKLLKAKHYFDLENPRDLARLEHPQLTLEPLRGLIVIDEVQRKPDLFPLLRYLADQKQGRTFLLLGSASPSLIKHGSETLAGRIAYYELCGLRLSDVGASRWKNLWLKGSLPLSYLYESPLSEDWRSHYIFFRERPACARHYDPFLYYEKILDDDSPLSRTDHKLCGTFPLFRHFGLIRAKVSGHSSSDLYAADIAVMVC